MPFCKRGCLGRVEYGAEWSGVEQRDRGNCKQSDATFQVARVTVASQPECEPVLLAPLVCSTREGKERSMANSTRKCAFFCCATPVPACGLPACLVRLSARPPPRLPPSPRAAQNQSVGQSGSSCPAEPRSPTHSPLSSSSNTIIIHTRRYRHFYDPHQSSTTSTADTHHTDTLLLLVGHTALTSGLRRKAYHPILSLFASGLRATQPHHTRAI